MKTLEIYVVRKGKLVFATLDSKEAINFFTYYDLNLDNEDKDLTKVLFPITCKYKDLLKDLLED